MNKSNHRTARHCQLLTPPWHSILLPSLYPLRFCVFSSLQRVLPSFVSLFRSLSPEPTHYPILQPWRSCTSTALHPSPPQYICRYPSFINQSTSSFYKITPNCLTSTQHLPTVRGSALGLALGSKDWHKSRYARPRMNSRSGLIFQQIRRHNSSYRMRSCSGDRCRFYGRGFGTSFAHLSRYRSKVGCVIGCIAAVARIDLYLPDK